MLLAALLLAAEYCAKESAANMLPDPAAPPRALPRGAGAAYWRARAWRAAALLLLLALAFRPDRWFLVVVVAQILIGSAELPISRLQGKVRSWAGSSFVWLQLAPMLLTLSLAALTSQFATFAPGALSSAIWLAASAVLGDIAHLTPLKLAAVFAAFAFMGGPSNHIVRCMLGKEVAPSTGVVATSGPSGILSDAGPMPRDNGEYPDASTLRAGRAIGTLERWIMAVFLALGQYSAMGLTLTAKSIARFSRIEKDPSFAEYYLLGTLYSMLIALLVGLALKVVLR